MNTLTDILIYVVIVVLTMAILREPLLWYWKIKERIDLQREQIKLTKALLEHLNGPSKDDSMNPEKLLKEGLITQEEYEKFKESGKLY